MTDWLFPRNACAGPAGNWKIGAAHRETILQQLRGQALTRWRIMTCAVFGVSRRVHIVVRAGACVYALLISPGFLPSVAWFAGPSAPTPAEPSLMFLQPLHSFEPFFSRQISPVLPPLCLVLCVYSFFFCTGVFHSFLSPGHLSHPSSFHPPPPPFPPSPAICSPTLAISPPPIHPSPSFLLCLFPHGLVQMSDQTEQHDSQRLAEFPLVGPVAIKQHCVQNLKPALKNMKHWQTKLWLG